MRAELEKLNSGLDAMSREELILSIRRLMEECSEKDAQLEINSAASTEMSVQYQQIRDENAALKKENRELLRQNRKLTEELRRTKNDLYGRKSEQSSGIEDAVLDESPADPLEETPDEEVPAPGPERSPQPKTASGSRGKKSPGKREQDLSGLPTRTSYEIDVEALDREYGEGNWRIAFWRKEDTLESAHTVQYHKRTFRPVISVGLEHELVCPYACGKILPGSLASPSLAAEMMYQKVVQCVPSYRMEADFFRSGIPVSRQTITGWINRFSHEFFAIVSGYMGALLCQRAYSQCDETFYEVIRDGRKAGAKSFMWTHTTSELDPGYPIIVYRFELTRSAEHLRRFYGDAGFAGNITSDAYSAYGTLEKEYPDIQGSGCFMHARRRFYYAAMLSGAGRKGGGPVRDLPEVRALSMIDEIYDADRPLKAMPPQERLQLRQSEVKKRVDAFFSYIRTLDADDPSYSDKMKDAIQYSLNQEEKLRRFLEDPMIPADNGFAERCIKPFTTARRNWLFSCSIEGAEAAAILFTLIETAKANQAHPYYYLKYLLETLPGQKVSKTNSFLDDCMPWSDAYRTYESDEKKAALRFFEDQCPPERPRTPRRKNRSA